MTSEYTYNILCVAAAIGYILLIGGLLILTIRLITYIIKNCIKKIKIKKILKERNILKNGTIVKYQKNDFDYLAVILKYDHDFDEYMCLVLKSYNTKYTYKGALAYPPRRSIYLTKFDIDFSTATDSELSEYLSVYMSLDLPKQKEAPSWLDLCTALHQKIIQECTLRLETLVCLFHSTRGS